MPKTLISQNTADAYTDQGGANINSVYESRGGWVTHSAQVYAQIQHSPQGAQQGQEQWSEEFVLPSGAHYLQPGLIGIRFRSFTPGNPVAISAAIFFRDEPAMQLGGSGISTPATSVASLNFQRNDVAVATEPTADFMDESHGNNLVWTVVDDVANTRVRITPVWQNPTVFPFSISTGPTSNAFSGAQTTGIFLSTSGRHTAFNSVSFVSWETGLTTDTVGRFNMNYAGQFQWGPGGATAVDLTFSRTNVSRCQFGTAGQTARVDIQSQAIGNVVFSTFIQGDTQPRLDMLGDGQIQWGTGALAVDTSLLRSTTNPPSGTAIGLQTNNPFTVNDPAGLKVIQTTNNSAFTTWLLNTDANPNFKIFTQGALSWGPGGASALDLEIARVTNSPTGTGTFLELILGAAFGYGTGAGGTATVAGLSLTLNKGSGLVSFTGQSNTASVSKAFTVTNSVVGADDTVIVSLNNTTTAAGQFLISTAVTAGSFTIIIFTTTANAAVTYAFNFSVIKGAVA